MTSGDPYKLDRWRLTMRPSYVNWEDVRHYRIRMPRNLRRRFGRTRDNLLIFCPRAGVRDRDGICWLCGVAFLLESNYYSLGVDFVRPTPGYLIPKGYEVPAKKWIVTVCTDCFGENADVLYGGPMCIVGCIVMIDSHWDNK
jgi:hypothetical protein